jgi:hypothetical protein
MVPAGACCIVEAAISGAGRAISLVVATVSGAEAAVVPLGAKSLHPAREVLNALQEPGAVDRSADTSELRRGDGFHDAVFTAGRSI